MFPPKIVDSRIGRLLFLRVNQATLLGSKKKPLVTGVSLLFMFRETCLCCLCKTGFNLQAAKAGKLGNRICNQAGWFLVQWLIVRIYVFAGCFFITL